MVDRLSKQAIFIPTHDTITSPELTKLFLLHMFSKHGVPAHVTSDRGTEFVSHFFRSLWKALDMRLHFTSGYHPEGDGQTERSNQTLEQYLRIYCNYQQDNWADLLPLAEFAYNNTPSATTGDKRLVRPQLVTAWIQRLRITSVDPLRRFRSRGVDGDRRRRTRTGVDDYG